MLAKLGGGPGKGAHPAFRQTPYVASGRTTRIACWTKPLRGSCRCETAVTLEEGKVAKVTFQLTPDSKERAIEGRIVRICVNDRDPDGLWPRLIAVEFEDPEAELKPLLDELAQKGGPPV